MAGEVREFDITEEKLVEVIKKRKNWSSPCIGGIRNYWLERYGIKSWHGRIQGKFCLSQERLQLLHSRGYWFVAPFFGVIGIYSYHKSLSCEKAVIKETHEGFCVSCPFHCCRCTNQTSQSPATNTT